MSRLSRIPDRAKAAVGWLLLAVAVTAVACEEDGKTAPDRCADPVLPIYDIQGAGEPSEAEVNANPCVTKVGHSISSIGTADSGGATTGGTAGAASGGKGGKSGTGGVGGLGLGGLGGKSGLGGKGGGGGTKTVAGAGGA